MRVSLPVFFGREEAERKLFIHSFDYCLKAWAFHFGGVIICDRGLVIVVRKVINVRISDARNQQKEVGPPLPVALIPATQRRKRGSWGAVETARSEAIGNGEEW